VPPLVVRFVGLAFDVSRAQMARTNETLNRMNQIKYSCGACLAVVGLGFRVE
jgi:hypothetical protein